MCKNVFLDDDREGIVYVINSCVIVGNVMVYI